MGMHETLNIVDKQKQLYGDAIDIINDILVFIERGDSESIRKKYSEYKNLYNNIQDVNYNMLVALKKESLGDFDVEKAIKNSNMTLYWSAMPGNYLHPEVGKPISDVLDYVSAAFTGTVSEWNHTLLERASDLATRISSCEDGIMFISKRMYFIIRNSPLFVPVLNGHFLGRALDFDVYLEPLMKKDEILVVANNGKSGIIKVLNLL